MTFRMQLSLMWIVTLLIHISCSGATLRIPKIEYCVSFWAKNITCYWDALPDTDPPTTYTLHVTEEAGRCRRDFGDTGICVAALGEHSCGVAVENLFAFYKVQLAAESQQVRGNSSEKCFHGMSIVKLSSPVVTSVMATQSCCFQLEWSLPADELLSATQAQYEIQYRDTAEVPWTQVNFTVAENAPTVVNVCGAFPFTNYSVRVRAKYLHSPFLQSDGEPSWSDWSTERFVRTLPAVPSRGPALWRKLGTPGADGMRVVVLMWKPLKPKEANGEVSAYHLHSQRKGEMAVPQCLTRDLQCTLLLPAKEGLTFFITASNAVGMSPPNKLVIPPFDSQEVPPSPLPALASPASDHSILLQWSLLSFPRMGYVFEWGRLPGKLGDGSCWHYQPGNINHVVISEAIEPGNLYGLKIFALLDGNVWAMGSTSAYSKQIAPLRAPTLYPIRVWKSRVELQWEKLPLEERGGEIQNYTICYEEEGKDEKRMVVIPDSSVHRYLIEGLAPGSTVRVSIAVATEGGSTEGPVLSIRTKIYDYGEAELLLSVLCLGFPFLLFLAASLACLCKRRLLPKCLWPRIPDPAKSNLATWMPHKTILDFSPCCTEKRGHGYLGVAIGGLLRVLPSRQEEPEPKTFLGSQWLVELASTLQKTSPGLGSGATTRERGKQPQKSMASWNEVEYSFVVQKSCAPEETWRSPPHLWSLSKCPDPANACPGSQFGSGVWLQNLTYEALLEVGSCNRALEPAGEFPLLVSLVAVEGGLHAAESPHRAPQGKN